MFYEFPLASAVQYEISETDYESQVLAIAMASAINYNFS